MAEPHQGQTVGRGARLRPAPQRPQTERSMGFSAPQRLQRQVLWGGVRFGSQTGQVLCPAGSSVPQRAQRAAGRGLPQTRQRLWLPGFLQPQRVQVQPEGSSERGVRQL